MSIQAKLGEFQLELVKRINQFEAQYGFPPVALVMGPEIYLQLSNDIKMSGANMDLYLRSFVGIPIRIKTTPGLAFEIAPKDVVRFACSRK